MVHGLHARHSVEAIIIAARFRTPSALVLAVFITLTATVPNSSGSAEAVTLRSVGHSNQPDSDAAITAAVRRLIDGDELLRGSDINIETDDRIVTLAGVVNTSAAKVR